MPLINWLVFITEMKSLLRGTNWVFKWSSLRFVFKGLILIRRASCGSSEKQVIIDSEFCYHKYYLSILSHKSTFWAICLQHGDSPWLNVKCRHAVGMWYIAVVIWTCVTCYLLVWREILKARVWNLLSRCGKNIREGCWGGGCWGRYFSLRGNG